MEMGWRWDFAYEILPQMLWATLNTIIAAGVGYVIALVVGFILAAINHGDRILLDQMKSIDWIKVVVTFFVPYSVATISAVLTLIKKS